MANSVANVDEVTDAMDRGALAERAAVPSASHWLPSMRDVSSRVRAQVQRTAGGRHAVSALGADDAAVEPMLGFKVLRHRAVGTGPISDLAVAGGRVFTANYADDSVTVLDARTLALVENFCEVYEPQTMSTLGRRVFVSTVSPSYDTVTVIEGGRVASTIAVKGSVRSLAASPDGTHVYLARTHSQGADLAILDTAARRISTVELGAAAPVALAVSPDGTRVYVASVDHTGGLLAAVDARGRRIVGAVAVPSAIRDIAVSPDGKTVYVVSDDTELGGAVDVVDARQLRITDTIELGESVSRVELSVDGERAYIVNGGRVTVLCTATHEIVDHIVTAAEPSAVRESEDGGTLFVGDYRGGLTVLAVAWTSNKLLAEMIGCDVIDVPMLELEPAGV